MDSISQRGGDEQQPNLSSSSSPPPSGGGGENMHEAARPLLPKAAAAATPNFIGKHRMAAAVAHLHQQIQIIQEELDELETIGEASLVCKELVSTVESVPDALLPVTKAPALVSWDQWFQGAHGSRGRKRWI